MATEVPDGVKRDRRDALDAGTEAFIAARRRGDEESAARELDALKALELVVPDESGRLVTGPDVATD